jgi:hypothetical protein
LAERASGRVLTYTGEHMKIEELKAAVAAAQAALTAAQEALSTFEGLPENNVFATLAEVGSRLEYVLLSRAHKDCEGSYNCGSPQYSQEFIVNGMLYVAVLDVEYNRHDRTYYYIDDSDFKIKEVGSY